MFRQATQLKASVSAAAVLAVSIAGGIPILRDEGSPTDLPEITPPWNAPVPQGPPEQIEAAKDLARYLRILPGEGNQGRVRELEWTTFWQDRPIGNLHHPALRNLLSDHWFVYFTEAAEAGWQFKYFDPDGTLWICQPTDFARQRFELHRYRYRIVDDLAGAATYISVRAEDGWPDTVKTRSREWVIRPIVFDPATGTLVVHHAEPTGRWYRHTGHMQREYHPAFSTLCPNIPRFARSGIDADQDIVPRTYEEFRDSISRRQIVRNVPTLFRQDPGDPLTMGMYFALYPPPGP